MFRLNRNHIFLIGLLTGFLFVGINIFNFYKKSDFAKGHVFGWYGSEPAIFFEVDGKKIRFLGESALSIRSRDEVTVIYDVTNPKNAAVFSFSGFFLRYFLFLSVPLLVFWAFIYSWFERHDYVVMDFKNRSVKKMNLNQHKELN